MAKTALRPKIVKLAKMIGGVAGAINKIDENAPEYYALAGVVSDEMADVALVMDDDQPKTMAAGDVMITGDGHCHSIENVGEDDLELMALILLLRLGRGSQR